MSGHEAISHILLIEDNPSHAALLEAFFNERETPFQLRAERGGEAAWDYLQHRVLRDKAPRPSLIFLDLEMPGLSGLELLKRMKADTGLRSIPVAIPTVSDDAEAARMAYDLCAIAFITKPKTTEEFTEMMQRIEAFLNLIELPLSD